MSLLEAQLMDHNDTLDAKPSSVIYTPRSIAFMVGRCLIYTRQSTNKAKRISAVMRFKAPCCIWQVDDMQRDYLPAASMPQ